MTGSETEEEARAAEKLPIQLPFPRTFDDVHSQRVHMKQKLAAGFRLLAKYGWDEGVAGHMTLRDPEYPDLFWYEKKKERKKKINNILQGSMHLVNILDILKQAI